MQASAPRKNSKVFNLVCYYIRLSQEKQRNSFRINAASNNDVAIITEKLLCRTTLCFEALTFNLISEDLERNLLACIDVSHFDQPIPMHHNELFPFAVNINIPDTNLCMFHPSLEIHTISQQAKSYSLYKSALLQNKQTHQSYFWLLVHLK